MAAGRGLGLLTCCWVLALLPALSGASRLANAQQTERGLLESNSNKVFRASLMHRDHLESPLSVPSTTTEARFYATAARENARMARRSLAATAVEFNTSISYESDDEEYVMTLYLGTPVQKFVLIVDTGSDLVWVQCVPCVQCYNETNPFFDPSKSNTYSAVSCNNSSCNSTSLGNQAFCNSVNTCQIHYAYGQEGSEYEGILSTETITFNNSTHTVPNILFGCMNNNTASFGLIDGFVGFGRGAFSLPSQLSKLNSVNVFSYCLVPFDVSTTLASSLVFGVLDTNDLELVYTPILNYDSTFYWVNLTGISINGVDVNVSMTSLEYNSTSQSGGTIFDSGTTYIYFYEDIWTVVTQNLKDLIDFPLVPIDDNVTICYNTSGVQNVAYPNMTLHFAGLDSTIVDFELTGQNLFITLGEDIDCLAMSRTTNDIGINIIGNVAQADHYVESDLENMKIGWKSRDCSLPM